MKINNLFSAPTWEECESKLAAIIEKTKTEIAEEKARLKAKNRVAINKERKCSEKEGGGWFLDLI